MKRTLSCLLAVLLLCGCMDPIAPATPAATTAPTATASPTPTVSPSPAPTATPSPAPTSEAELSDDLFSFSFALDEEVYQLPMPFKEMLARGWVLREGYVEDVEVGEVAVVTFVHPSGVEAMANVHNFDINTQPIEQCAVTSLSIFIYALERAQGEPSVRLPGGAVMGMTTPEEAKELYGEPTYTHEDKTLVGGYVSYSYQLTVMRQVNLAFFGERDGKLCEIQVQNQVEPEEFVPSAPKDEVSEEAKNYRAPTALTDNFADYVVSFGGDRYKLPAPMSAFVDNGWTFDAGEDEPYVKGNGSTTVHLRRDNQSVRVIVSNHMADASGLANCFVHSLFSDTVFSPIPMEVAQGVAMGMPRKEIMRVLDGLGVEIDVREVAGRLEVYSFYATEDGSGGYMIQVGKVSNVIIGIEMWASHKDSRETEE